MAEFNDTIVAVSSPPGRSARGLIRLCGPHVRQVLNVCGIDWPDARQMRSVLFTLTSQSPQSPRCHLPMLMTVFVKPHSYTGQDMVELQLPGNPALLERVLHQFMDAGARLAEAGEFTFRAYTNGKIDLTCAEGVAATIAATSDAQLEAAGHLRRGELGQFAERLVQKLTTLLALVEAGIDFVDQEDVVPIPAENLLDQLQLLNDELTQLLNHNRSWADLEALPRVVLAGPPSVGKSTLFNALLGHDRAVIDAMPGTTRDVIEESLIITTSNAHAFEIMLVDMAGLDDVTAVLDRSAQCAAQTALLSADLVLDVHCHGDAHPLLCERPMLRVRTMADQFPLPQGETDNMILVHAPTGRGLDQLRDAIAGHLTRIGPTARSEGLTLQPRHEQTLRGAQEQIAATCAHLRTQDNRAIEHVELVASMLRSGLDQLGELGGQMTPDDVIGRVFATFCIGK